MTLRTAAHTAGLVEGALDARLDAAALWAVDGANSLAVRTGVVWAPGNPMKVSGTASTSPWTVTVEAGHVVGLKGPSNGPYYAANDAQYTVNLASPPASNSRIDVIYAMQEDTAAFISPDGTTAAVIGAVTGTAAASPTAPAIPTGAVELAQVLIASTATTGTSGAGVTITQTNQWTTTRGNPIPVRNATEQAALTAYEGLQVNRLDLHTVIRYNGTGWAAVTAPLSATTGRTGTPSGVILEQVGYQSVSTGAGGVLPAVTFPAAFPNGLIGVWLTTISGQTTNPVINGGVVTVSGFTAIYPTSGSGVACAYCWQAKGW